MDPTFSPPLHKQRHQFVIDFVKRNKPKQVADLGCSECTLLKQLKFHHEVELLVGMDINGAKLRKKMHGLAPVSTDYLEPSYDQLRIDLYQGSVTQRDSRLRGFDLVTVIELIEHLTLTDVECFSKTVFGFMRPEAVIISTPNSEFNPLFSRLEGFRNSDHKFEWTRAEFKSWALKVCLQYGYEVEFTGVGQAPPGLQDRVGFCSQIGVFHRLRGRAGCHMECDDGEAEKVFSYTLLYSINYPSLRDNNILRRVLVTEVLYWVEQLKIRWMEEKTRERSGTYTQAEDDGKECLRVKQTAACVAEMTDLLEHQEGEDAELFWTNGQQGSGKLHRCVSIPLTVLWSCCPKVSALSGSLCNLQYLLMDNSDVKLNQDGSAVLLNIQNEDLEEEEEKHPDDLEDSGYAEASHHSCSAQPEEDWDDELYYQDK